MKSKRKVSLPKKKVIIQIGKEKFKNLILAFLSLISMSLCPVIKIVHHTQEIYRGFVFNVLLELFKKNIFPQTVLYKYRAQNT